MVQEIALSTIDQSKWVVYVHMFPFEIQSWIRPYDEWCDGRFRKLNKEEYETLLSKDRKEFQKAITVNKALMKR